MDIRRALPLALVAALAACAWAPKLPQERPCRRAYLFWPSRDANHTSLLIRREDFPVAEVFVSSTASAGRRLLPGEEAPSGPHSKPPEWLEVGFASADYLQARRSGGFVTDLIVLRKTPGAVYIRPFSWGGDPQDWQTTYTAFGPLDLPAAGYRGLLGFVADSFARDASGRLSPPLFTDEKESKSVYAAVQPYSFRMFCNVWALTAVRAGGVPVSTWMPGHGQVEYWYDNTYRPSPVCAPAPTAGSGPGAAGRGAGGT
ncbi:MAG: DUF2459 domain-containing protein [Elusimicrobia bacterium]|nr:DUF2459 domain-containing protein [Elusimicrobiota bacterium]